MLLPHPAFAGPTLAGAALAAWVLGATAASTMAAPLKTRSVFESANAMAMAVTHAGDARVFVAQRNGSVTVFADKYPKTGAAFLKVASTSCLCINDESGLMGMAFHPDFKVKDAYGYGKFYLYYTLNGSGHDGLYEYRVTGDPATSNQGDPATRREILTVTTGGMHHNGGALAFDNKKMLFLGIGDGNRGDPSRAWAQGFENFHGKVLRLDVGGTEGGKGYRIPADNPEWPGRGRNEVYALGLRNAYRLYWDKAAKNGAGALVVGDVGQTGFEEINLVEAGKNYGWGWMEGRACQQGRDCSAFTPPIHLYPSGSAAVIGGVVYRGKAMPARQGQYFFADYYYQYKVMEAPYASAAPAVSNINPLGTRRANSDEVFSFGEDADGEVYAMAWKGIYILEETTPSALRAPRGWAPAARGIRFAEAGRYEIRDLQGRPMASAPGRGLYLARVQGGTGTFERVLLR